MVIKLNGSVHQTIAMFHLLSFLNWTTTQKSYLSPMTGEVWNHICKNEPESIVKYATNTSVFGRCTPDDKLSIAKTFVEQGTITLMCGDGGNDCSALKAAHVGIAL